MEAATYELELYSLRWETSLSSTKPVQGHTMPLYFSFSVCETGHGGLILHEKTKAYIVLLKSFAYELHNMQFFSLKFIEE